MKRNAFFGLLATLLVFGFVGCATVNVSFTPTENLNDPGFILTGDSIGNFRNEDPSYEWKFLLVSGAGDTDNNLFEIKNGNILVAKRSLQPRDYSVRVKMLGINQDEGNSGIQNIFTFTVTVEPPPPEPVDFPQGFQGSWLRPGDPSSFTNQYNKKLIIEGHNIKVDLANDWKADYVLMGISESMVAGYDSYYIVNTADAGIGINVNIKLADGNIEIAGADNGPGYWAGTYLKQ